MKTFTNTQSLTNWMKTITKETTKEALPIVTKQIYVDGRKYIFYDTGDMYKTGDNQAMFDKGYVLIKAPQVRRLYYTSWAKNRTNPTSVPMWWEATKRENINSYKKIIVDIFNRKKGA